MNTCKCNSRVLTGFIDICARVSALCDLVSRRARSFQASSILRMPPIDLHERQVADSREFCVFEGHRLGSYVFERWCWLK